MERGSDIDYTYYPAMAESSSSFAALLTSALCLSDDILHRAAHVVCGCASKIRRACTHTHTGHLTRAAFRAVLGNTSYLCITHK